MCESAYARSMEDGDLCELLSWMVKSWKELPQSCVFLTHSQSVSWLHALVSVAKYIDCNVVSDAWSHCLEMAVFSENLIDVVFEIAFEGCLRQDTSPLEYAAAFSTIALSRLQHRSPDLLLVLAQYASFLNVLEHLSEHSTIEWVHHSNSATKLFGNLSLTLCNMIKPNTSPEFLELYQRLQYVQSHLV